ncbi:MAG: DnaD domain protein [Bacilli bacterium]|nr:DnaD domain protein [Bacilli bacterium]
MFDKVLNIIENKNMVIPRILMFNYKELNITDSELILLIYLINSDGYNPKEISENLKIELINLLDMINELNEKGIINISMETKNNKKVEVISLKPLYEKLTFLVVNEEEEKDNTIFSIIENEFARSLSPLEYDLINLWKDTGYSDELIKEALKEAIYNNAPNLKYIDRILENWRKKGIKTKDDVIKDNKKFKERKQIRKETSDADWDWLNDEE